MKQCLHFECIEACELAAEEHEEKRKQ